MIYLDSAATMLPRAPGVQEAVASALRNAGNPGRGGHTAASFGDRVVFGTSDPTRYTFALNATDALNQAIMGFVPDGSNVVSTMMEHNSVLRPLYRISEERGVSLTLVPPAKDGAISALSIEDAIESDTSLVAINAVSNVTGAVQPIDDIAKLAHSHGLPILVDLSQAAGHMPIDISSLDIDIAAFPGHKGLMGPPGTGALYTSSDITLEPFRVGGTGVDSFSKTAPNDLPERYESGTQNVTGIAGLSSALEHIENITPEKIHLHERALSDALIGELLTLEGCVVYSPADPDLRSGVVAFNIGDMESSAVANALARRDICVRGGYHCAPLMHVAMGTEKRGAVRASFSISNTPDDVDGLMRALSEIIRTGGR